MQPTLATTLANQCGPVLLGVKPAAVFPRPEGWPRYARLLSRRGLCSFLLPRKNKNVLVFVYRQDLLAKTLAAPPVLEALAGLGYPASGNVDALFCCLARRAYEAEDFPHEIGFFLGYPPEDVLGFMRHKGAGYKLRGAWKVYGDEQKARALFDQHEYCRQLLLEGLRKGGRILGMNMAAGTAAN